MFSHTLPPPEPKNSIRFNSHSISSHNQSFPYPNILQQDPEPSIQPFLTPRPIPATTIDPDFIPRIFRSPRDTIHKTRELPNTTCFIDQTNSETKQIPYLPNATDLTISNTTDFKFDIKTLSPKVQNLIISRIRYGNFVTNNTNNNNNNLRKQPQEPLSSLTFIPDRFHPKIITDPNTRRRIFEFNHIPDVYDGVMPNTFAKDLQVTPDIGFHPIKYPSFNPNQHWNLNQEFPDRFFQHHVKTRYGRYLDLTMRQAQTTLSDNRFRNIFVSLPDFTDRFVFEDTNITNVLNIMSSKDINTLETNTCVRFFKNTNIKNLSCQELHGDIFPNDLNSLMCLNGLYLVPRGINITSLGYITEDTEFVENTLYPSVVEAYFDIEYYGRYRNLFPNLKAIHIRNQTNTIYEFQCADPQITYLEMFGNRTILKYVHDGIRVMNLGKKIIYKERIPDSVTELRIKYNCNNIGNVEKLYLYLGNVDDLWVRIPDSVRRLTCDGRNENTELILGNEIKVLNLARFHGRCELPENVEILWERVYNWKMRNLKKLREYHVEFLAAEDFAFGKSLKDVYVGYLLEGGRMDTRGLEVFDVKEMMGGKMKEDGMEWRRVNKVY